MLVGVGEVLDLGTLAVVRHTSGIIKGCFSNVKGFHGVASKRADVVGLSVVIPTDNLDKFWPNVPGLQLAITPKVVTSP